VSVPSSASEPIAEQVNVEPTTTFDDGEMLGVEIVGGVFSTVTIAVSETVVAVVSVAEAVQTMSKLDRSEAKMV